MQVTKDLFDIDWKPIFEVVASGEGIPGDGSLEKPKCFDEMVEIARKLSADFRFVRVDLYELDGKVYFGELTFTPAHCVFPSFSERFIQEMGACLTLD